MTFFCTLTSESEIWPKARSQNLAEGQISKSGRRPDLETLAASAISPSAGPKELVTGKKKKKGVFSDFKFFFHNFIGAEGPENFFKMTTGGCKTGSKN